MTCSNWTHQDFDYTRAMWLLPEISSTISSLTKRIIAGPNNTLCHIATWDTNNVTFDGNGEIIDDDDTVEERNIAVLGALESDGKNYKSFNKMKEKANDFIAMNSSWVLIHVIATNADQNEECNFFHVIVETKQDNNLIESAGKEVLLFQFTSKAYVANYWFTKTVE